VDKASLREYVINTPNLVTMKESIAFPGVYVLKYKRKVFFDSLWNEFLEECRGTLVDADFNVISRPFTKIYNYAVEASSPVLPDNTMVTAHRKVNGFMVAVTWHNDRLLISTTGSTDSPFVAFARDVIGDNIRHYEDVCRANPEITYLFECVHPDDPHIVPEKVGMYLLGYREKTWDSNIETGRNREFDAILGTIPVESYRTTLGELLAEVKKVHHEGFVGYTDDNQSFKIKSPFYLASKFVARNPNTKKLFNPNAKEILDEEYYPLLSHLKANIDEFTALSEQDRLAYVRKFLGA